MANANEKNGRRAETIVEIDGLTKTFDGVTVIDGLSIAIRRGQFVTLLGPSGCGKTTLLRIIAGLERPTKGRVAICGRDMTDAPPHRRPVNTVFQSYALFPHLNVYKNIAYGLKVKRLAKDVIREKVRNVLKLVDLEGYEARNVASLSGGQRQRVAIARAVVCEPEVLLLDEPLGALDLKMRKEMQYELTAMHERLGITFVYVTHDQEEALTMSDVVIVMNDGAVQQVGRPKEIYDEPSNAFVASFIGESNIISGTMPRDFRVRFLNAELDCSDRGFGKNERVDLVIRPEDISMHPAGSGKGAFSGEVVATAFKGMCWQSEVRTDGYEFTVRSVKERKVGEKVELGIEPDGIHIMKKLRVVNEFAGEVTSERAVSFCGGEFEFVNDGTFAKGDRVLARVGFDAITLTDDESDGTIGANIAGTLYKGRYNQVRACADSDDDFYVDTVDEWDIGDRVGVLIDKTKLRLEKVTEGGDDARAGD